MNQPKVGSLKQRNAWPLRFVLIVNVLLSLGVFLGTQFGLEGKLLNLTVITKSAALFSVAGVFTIAISQAVPEDWKHVLVFWRFKDVLPGHRAFSIYAKRDPRIDQTKLEAKRGAYPSAPRDQNQLWYAILKDQERTNEYILENHRVFLLLRDVCEISLLLLIAICIGFVIFRISWPLNFWLPALLSAEFVITNLAAHNTGIELVKNVLAAEATSN